MNCVYLSLDLFSRQQIDDVYVFSFLFFFFFFFFSFLFLTKLIFWKNISKCRLLKFFTACIALRGLITLSGAVNLSKMFLCYFEK